ncbi:MAG: peptidoglycan-binding protein, partial [Planctomycetaceae bacterium]|nr:peptidoglycan-binding protein [Planctomycetaceae bacterium]
AVCVLTTNNKDQRWDDDNAAHVLMGRIGKIAFEHFNPAWDAPSPGADLSLKVGAFGEQVEYLQRTLNARLQPSPGLGVDGDFGPATEAAVRLFQERNSLAVNGIVNSEFWKLLGPVVEETEVPAPEVVNAEVLPRQPVDSLDGVPFVSCDAWTIVDAADGRELAGKDSAVRRDFASTTKMMTAWLVAELALRKPEVLNETLTMSARADETRGSTSDLRTREQVTVHDALYGLMLPSGNDMSVALAEHFGNRVARDEGTATAASAASQDPLEQFVAVMNAEALSLGMSDTHYINPHGMTDKDHLSTALDLSRLARSILSNELLRKVTSTRQFGTTVTGAAGYRRNVMWKNTNELLGIEGFDGVKTGTTDQAGACLVSTGERDGRRLIVVVLGSAASEARYTDSRNLYRWAWKELAGK